MLLFQTVPRIFVVAYCTQLSTQFELGEFDQEWYTKGNFVDVSPKSLSIFSYNDT